jgi:hypothetical protein
LRTYQSRFFDIKAAIREAFRVLKPSGAIVISIANGYIDKMDGHQVIVRGLLLLGKRSVDQMAPLRLGVEVYDILGAFGFTRLGVSQNRSDFYICARKASRISAASDTHQPKPGRARRAKTQAKGKTT